MNHINRRQILEWTVMASSTLLLAAGCGSSTNGTGTGTTSGSSGSSGAGGSDGGTEEASSMNALLALEYAAIAAYTAGAGIISSPPAGDPLAALGPTLLLVATHFQQQHKDHATALVAAVTAAGGTPVSEASFTFTAPTGFTPSISNVLKLASNAEKDAAVAYTQIVGKLGVVDNRFLASSISGDESQHFVVLYVILKGIAQPGMNLAAMTNLVVQTSFVSGVGTFSGLETVPDLAYS